MLMEHTTSLLFKTDQKVLTSIRMLRFSLLIVSINLSLKAYVINAERDLREYLRILMMDLALENGYFWVIFKKETPN